MSASSQEISSGAAAPPARFPFAALVLGLAAIAWPLVALFDRHGVHRALAPAVVASGFLAIVSVDSLVAPWKVGRPRLASVVVAAATVAPPVLLALAATGSRVDDLVAPGSLLVAMLAAAAGWRMMCDSRLIAVYRCAGCARPRRSWPIAPSRCSGPRPPGGLVLPCLDGGLICAACKDSRCRACAQEHACYQVGREEVTEPVTCGYCAETASAGQGRIFRCYNYPECTYKAHSGCFEHHGTFCVSSQCQLSRRQRRWGIRVRIGQPAAAAR